MEWQARICGGNHQVIEFLESLTVQQALMAKLGLTFEGFIVFYPVPLPDVASFTAEVDQPISQGESLMPAKFAAIGPITMLDDQMALIHWMPLEADGVTPGALPSGTVLASTAAPGTALTLDASVDPTGLTVNAKGVKGKAGSEVVSVSFTNADGSVATGSVTFTQTLDPKELDVASFGVTVDPPVAQ